ncbi:MAG: ATP-binding protein [Candidatus Hodarchaeota archaeon]
MIKELTVISGKGGTGKTTITAAFAALAENAVYADCDVDASNLHLILKPTIKETTKFTGLRIAIKDNEKCNQCGTCLEHCRFDAITDDGSYSIIDERCEGCGVCRLVCPEEAIRLEDRDSGRAYISDTRFGPMVHANLNIAEEASGKLVTLVRNYAKRLSKEHNRSLIIVDGPPGIGCPVIAAISGVTMVLVVTEPTVSGIHDMERVLGVAKHFNIPASVCINKYDINLENSKKIEEYCQNHGIQVIAKLLYDDITTQAMITEKTIIEFSDGEFTQNIKSLWNEIQKKLLELGNY